MGATKPEDVPIEHKVAVYDAICRHFEGSLTSYFTHEAEADPRYDTGTAEDETVCIGIRVEGDGLYVVMAIKGWSDLQGFSVDLPKLEKYDHVDDGTSLTLQRRMR